MAFDDGSRYVQWSQRVAWGEARTQGVPLARPGSESYRGTPASTGRLASLTRSDHEGGYEYATPIHNATSPLLIRYNSLLPAHW
jgi:hypothetical protein